MNKIVKKSILFGLLLLIANPTYPAFGMNIVSNIFTNMFSKVQEHPWLTVGTVGAIAVGSVWLYAKKRGEKLVREERAKKFQEYLGQDADSKEKRKKRIQNLTQKQVQDAYKELNTVRTEIDKLQRFCLNQDEDLQNIVKDLFEQTNFENFAAIISNLDGLVQYTEHDIQQQTIPLPAVQNITKQLQETRDEIKKTLTCFWREQAQKWQEQAQKNLESVVDALKSNVQKISISKNELVSSFSEIAINVIAYADEFDKNASLDEFDAIVTMLTDFNEIINLVLLIDTEGKGPDLIKEFELKLGLFQNKYQNYF